MNTFRDAIDIYGTTQDFREAGYILPDGSLLDFSEKKNGGEKGQRSLDHRDVQRLYGNLRGTNALIQFMNEGGIRLMPESGGVDISVRPTPEQYERLLQYTRYSNRCNDGVHVDISDSKGNRVATASYRRESSAGEVITALRLHFSRNCRQ
jgi:hypothetical protein